MTQPQRSLCSATARASRVTLPGSSPRLVPGTRGHTERCPPHPAAAPPGGLLQRPGVGSRAVRRLTGCGTASCSTCGRFLIATGRPASCGHGRAQARAGTPVVSGPRFPFRGPPPSGRCPPGSARRPRPTPRSQPCTPHTGFAIPGGRAECVYPLRGKQNRRAYEYGDAVAPRRQGAGSGT